MMQALLQHMREAARATVGGDERVAAEAEGQAMSPERAVAYALEEFGRWPAL
jgi:hypothetical protein